MNSNEHITSEIFNRYAARAATATEILFVQTHSAACEICREKLAHIVSPEKASASIRNDFAFEDFANAPEHLAYEQLEFFADNKLDEVDREIAESHLSICEECTKDLADLQMYRQIAETPAATGEIVPAAQKQSFRQKFFAFDSIGKFASVAAILLIAILFGAWFLLRGNRAGEIAQTNKNQNVTPANVNALNNSVQPDVSPEISPAPVEDLPNGETIFALNDGQLTVDDKGNVKGLENLSSSAQNLVRQSLQSGKISVAANSLGGNSGVLMGEANENSGVPFALQTPIGKIIRENQPVLRWKPLKDAASYEVAIVDEKFRVVEQSGKLTATSWKPSKPLPRGANYSWQVTATKTDGTETVSPSSPAPQARFRVVEQNLFDDLQRLEKSGTRSHLALGVLYAKAGLKQEARREFEALVKENPKSNLARKLLQSVK
ncbi:MAG: hypothetical protein ABWZ66_09410 [Pyrinomonadaceae bacterium]